MPWEETENEIRHRVRDPGLFEANSFRRITMKKDVPRVYAIIGHLKSETSTTVQALRFPKTEPDNWTLAKAKTWKKDHFSESKSGDDDYEVRNLEVEEIRIDEDGDTGPVIRVAIKFNSLSVPLGTFNRFREKIASTAFDGALNNESHEVLSFWNHNTDLPLGRRSAGTVAISKTPTLFKAEIHPGDTSWAIDAVKAIKRKDVKGTSFGFHVLPQGELWEEDEQKNLIRTLTNVDLIEVSPTPRPAYPTSSATIRSLEGALEQFQATDEERNALLSAQLAARHWRDRLLRNSVRRDNS